MKRLIYLLPLFLMSCGKFADGTSVWQGGMFIVPLLPFIGSIIFGYLTWKEYKKGGTAGWVNDANNVPKWTEDENKFPIWKASYFWYSVICLALTVVIIILVNGDK